MTTRARDRPARQEEEEFKKIREEMQSLSEQVAAIREIAVESVREEMKRKETRQEDPSSLGAGESQVQRGKETKKGGRQASKIVGNSSAARTRAIIKEPSSLEAADNSNAWSKVVGRKAKKKEAPRGKVQEASGRQEPPPMQTKKKRQPEVGGNRKPSIRPPRRAAVGLSIAPGGLLNSEEVLAKARSKINLEDLGINDVKIRFSVAGSILIEIPGEDRATKADNLMGRLREVFPESGDVRVTRPIKRTDVRITGLDVSV